MGRPNVYLHISEKEAVQLASLIKETQSNQVRTRAQAVWFSHQGQTIEEIAALLSVTDRAVRKWFSAYREGGVEALKKKPYPRRKTALSLEKEEHLVAITRQAPSTVGMEGHTWNCRLLSEWLDKTHHIRITDEWVRVILRKHNLRFRRPKLKLTSPDPEYAQKKNLLTN